MKNILKALLWRGYESLINVGIFVALGLGPFRSLVKNILPESKVYSLWAGTPIITLAHKANAEKRLGIEAKSLVYNTYFVTQSFDYNLSAWTAIPILGRLIPLIVFWWACLHVDRLHFFCDRSLLPSIQRLHPNLNELRLYQTLGIQVFFWTYGADVRSRDTTLSLGEPNCCSECDLVNIACICNESVRQHHIETLVSNSTALFSMGDMSEYTLGSRNDLFFWPLDIEGPQAHKYVPVYPQLDSQAPLKIVHAPNHRVFKGTHFLIEAVDALQKQGHCLDLILVEKVPNHEALELYRSADIIFDQCLIGFHGYFALEGMAMGKPVMCFIRKPQSYLLNPEECPIINTHISSLETDLKYLIKHRNLLRDIGIKGRQYIEKYFTLDAFAQRLKGAYRDLDILV